MKPISILSGVKVGPDFPVRIMGVLNASPESFYKGSIGGTKKNISRLAERMEEEGADFIDVGAMSSAPYLQTEISEQEETRRLREAVRAVRKGCGLPLSIDTFRLSPAEAGMAAGASILNDITGLTATPDLIRLAKQAGGVILMAHPRASLSKNLAHPIADTKKILGRIVERALEAGVSRRRLIVDPGIGFFRTAKIPWWKWDLSILKNLSQLKNLTVPLLIGISRKSFIGHLQGGAPAAERLSGSLAATAIAVLNGASIIRTHDVRATKEAVRIAESIRNFKSV